MNKSNLTERELGSVAGSASDLAESGDASFGHLLAFPREVIAYKITSETI